MTKEQKLIKRIKDLYSQELTFEEIVEKIKPEKVTKSQIIHYLFDTKYLNY